MTGLVAGISKGRKRGVWAREKPDGRLRKEEAEERVALLPSPSRAVSHLNLLKACHVGWRQPRYPINVFSFQANCYKIFKGRF